MIPALVVGARLGRYVIVRAADDGGPALAWDPALERRVALEVVDARAEPERARATLATARALSRLTSPHVPRVHVGGAEEDLVFFAREHEPSISLEAWLRRPRDRTMTRRILADAMRGLAAAHARELVHGEITADRVRIGPENRGFLDGFGAPGSVDDDRRAFAALLELPEVPRGRFVDAAAAAIGSGDLERAADEIEGLAARRRRRVLVVVAGAVVCIGAVVAWDAAVRARAGLCAAQDQLTGVWDEDARTELARAFAATGAPFADSVRAEVERRLDAHARSWLDAHARACTETHVERTADESILDLRMQCLQSGREDLDALASVLARADRDVVTRAVDATRALASPAACLDATALARRTPPGPRETELDAVADLRARISEARALVAAGRYADADRVAVEVDTAAQEIEHLPTRAETAALVGRVAAEAGRAAEAREQLVEAIALAWRSGHGQVAAQAWLELAYVLAERLGDADEALRACDHGRAAIERLGGDAELEGELLLTSGIALARSGRPDEAIGRFEEALALLQAADEVDPIAVAGALNNIANLQREAGRSDVALEHLRRAIELAEPHLGESHPQIGSFLNNLGGALFEHGDAAEAFEAWTRAHEIHRAVLGPEHPATLTALDNLGLALDELGRDDEALATLRDTLARREAVLGADHPAIGATLVHLGDVLVDVGDPEAARAAFERALALWERRLGPEHPWSAHALAGLARVALATEHADEAVQLLGRAVAVREKALGPAHAGLADDLVALAHAAFDAEQIEAARAALDRVRPLAPGEPEPAHAFALARRRWHDGDRTGARAAAKTVRAQIEGEGGRALRKRTIDDWLATH